MASLKWEHEGYKACYWSAGSIACDGARWIIRIDRDGLFDAKFQDGPEGQEHRSLMFSQLDSAKAWCQSIEDRDPPVIGWDDPMCSVCGVRISSDPYGSCKGGAGVPHIASSVETAEITQTEG